MFRYIHCEKVSRLVRTLFSSEALSLQTRIRGIPQEFDFSEYFDTECCFILPCTNTQNEVTISLGLAIIPSEQARHCTVFTTGRAAEHEARTSK